MGEIRVRDMTQFCEIRIIDMGEIRVKDMTQMGEIRVRDMIR